MKQKINGNYVELYDSMESMNIMRYILYNRYVMIDAGIGSDMDSIVNHFANLQRFILKEDKENALKEMVNMRQNIIFAVNMSSMDFMAFACLVKSINGKKYPNKLSEDDIHEIMEDLKSRDLTIGKMTEWLGEVKKKLKTEQELFFPSMVNPLTSLEYFSLLKKRALLMLDKIDGEDTNEDIYVVEEQLYGTYTPKTYGGKDGEEVRYVKNFNETLISLSKYLGIDASNLTALEFYQGLELAKKEAKEHKKIMAKR